MSSMHIAALMAAYNRRELTLQCLRSLYQQQVPGVALDIFVLDDASSDGTSTAIAGEFPEVVLLHGNGQMYWSGGMRYAFGAAIAGDYDAYLWMNDDTHLDDGALAVLLGTQRWARERGDSAAIIVGSTRHPQTGELTYGGLVRPFRWRPLRFRLVEPGDVPRACETMNGNTVLIPRAVVRRVGNIERGFIHQMGDLDYGLRARESGCSVWVAPGTIGTCASHPARRTDAQPLWQEWRRLWSVKELAPASWAVFTRRWSGACWPLFWLSPYLQRGARLVLERTPLSRLAAKAEVWGASSR